MYPSRFFETSRFHCRTKEPPGANLHLSASHSRGPSASSLAAVPPAPLEEQNAPRRIPNSLSPSPPTPRPSPLSLSIFRAEILLEIAARMFGIESEGREGYPGQRGNSFNRLIILFKPVAPLARHLPFSRVRFSPPAC